MSDLRAELRELRKKSPAHMSVSKMKLKDVALEVGKLRSHLESMPSIGLDGGASKKAMKGTVESVKEAKKAEFPVAPSGDHAAPKAAKKKAEKIAPVPEAPKVEEPVKKVKHAKGSEEAKAHMAAIRGKKGAKKE
jgi:uncharacterized Zn-binding protein involved in type VI secretion